MMENLAMGAYGAYVWTCFGLTVLVVGILEWRARSRHRKVYRDIEVRIRALGDKQ
jgi:heme exporter protein CcmD